MSLYFAHPAGTSTSPTVSPAVRDRGLSLLRAKPCDVQVTVLPYVVQTGYTCYVRNLPAFMVATVTGQRTLIANRGYPLPVVPSLLPWRLPKVIYDYPKKPTEQKMETLRQHSTIVKGRGKNVSFVLGEPTTDLIRTLVDDGVNTKTPHLIGTVNIDALKTVLVMRKVLSAFLLTHTYPAFRHSSDMQPVRMEERMPRSNKRRKVATASYIACATDTAANLEDSSEDEEEALMEIDRQRRNDLVVLRVAKPTPVAGQHAWGSIEDMPNASGVYVPYVKELAVADSSTVPDVVSRYFLRCLADTERTIFEQADKLRSAWGVISQTDLGHEVTHLCKCLDIAVQAQSFIYPVYTSNIYEGTVICGAGYSLGMKSGVVTPIDYADLQQTVRDNSAHSRSLETIRGLVPEGVSQQVTECGSIRELSTILKGVAMNEADKQVAVQAALHLSFSSRYWSTSILHVREMLGYLVDVGREIPSDVPMHPTYMFATDRIELVMSAFGHQAPTFMITNGAQCRFTVETPPKNLHVRTVATAAAILDMRYCLENGYVTNNMQNLSSKHRDAPIKSDDKVEVWRLLREAHGRVIGESAGSGQQARGAIPQGRSIEDDLF